MRETRAQAAWRRLYEINVRRGRGDDFKLPARLLVEFRCTRRGHFLGALYDTADGPLFASTAKVAAPAIRANAIQRKHEGHPLRGRVGQNPSPRLPLVDEPFSEDPAPVNCRCGNFPDLTRPALLWALGLPTPDKGAALVRVSAQQLTHASDTLSL